MKKIFSVLVAVVSAVTLMAQESPTACDAQIYFKYCFPTSGTDTRNVYRGSLPITWNGVEFKADDIDVSTQTITKTQKLTIPNARGCDTTVTMTAKITDVPDGCAGGSNAKLFSIGEGKQIYFSQGNLQYRATKDGTGTDLKRTCADGTEKQGVFRFATNQYDLVGDNNQSAFKNYNMKGNVYDENSVKCNNSSLAQTYTGWVDLFAWGASGYNGYHPYEPASDHEILYKSDKDAPIGNTLANTNYDWGVYNPIENGGNQPGTWRTLSGEEWDYLLLKRPEASSKVGKATITMEDGTTVNGIILLPDVWNGTTTLTNAFYNTKDTELPNFYIWQQNAYAPWTTNSFTLEQWASLEADGAVFLPAAGGMPTTVEYTYAFSRYYVTNGMTDTYHRIGYYLQITPQSATSAQRTNNNYSAIRLVATTGNTSAYAQRHAVRLVFDK